MSQTLTMDGYVTFVIGDREFAAALEGVREVLRLEGLEALPGMAPPMTGVVVLRGSPLPVMDLRPEPADQGDVLVLVGSELTGAGAVGIAVDGVTAVRSADELRPTGGETPGGLPAYVVEVLRDTVAGRPVLLVDLPRMLSMRAASAVAG